MASMPTLYIRDVPPEVYEQVKGWAEKAGRSVNAEVLALLEREAERRQGHSEWFQGLLELRKELGLTMEDAEDAIAAIRAHRDAGM